MHRGAAEKAVATAPNVRPDRVEAAITVEVVPTTHVPITTAPLIVARPSHPPTGATIALTEEEATTVPVLATATTIAPTEEEATTVPVLATVTTIAPTAETVIILATAETTDRTEAIAPVPAGIIVRGSGTIIPVRDLPTWLLHRAPIALLCCIRTTVLCPLAAGVLQAVFPSFAAS